MPSEKELVKEVRKHRNKIPRGVSRVKRKRADLLKDVLALTDDEKRELAIIDYVPEHIDPAMIQAWAQVDCTLQEICGLLGVSLAWFDDYRNANPEVDAALVRGRASARYGLRNAQMREALAGNSQLLIWMGKQMLGQSDKVQADVKVGISVALEDAVAELRALSKEDVLAIRSLMIEGDVVEVDAGAVDSE